jgi:phage portal protein BeeE
VNGDRYRNRLVHIKGIMQPGKLKGLSPVEAARQSIGLGLAQQEFGARFYSNGAQMSGIIKTPGDVDRDKARDIGEAFQRDHSGLANAWKPGVLFGGAEYQAVSVTPEQAQFLESASTRRPRSRADVPPRPDVARHPRRDDEPHLREPRTARHPLVQFSLLRWIVRLERAFSSLLPPAQTQKFNVNGLQRADLKTQYESFRSVSPTRRSSSRTKCERRSTCRPSTAATTSRLHRRPRRPLSPLPP